MIVSFCHKGLEQLYREGSHRGVQAAHVPKLRRILTALDVAERPADLMIPGLRTDPLSGDQAGRWSMRGHGSGRVTFRFVDTDVELLDYEDHH